MTLSWGDLVRVIQGDTYDRSNRHTAGVLDWLWENEFIGNTLGSTYEPKINKRCLTSNKKSAKNGPEMYLLFVLNPVLLIFNV